MLSYTARPSSTAATMLATEVVSNPPGPGSLGLNGTWMSKASSMAKIASTFDVPMLINVVEGGRTPVLPPKVLEEMGFALAIYPAAGFLAAGWALEQSYAQIKATRSSIGAKAPMADFMDFSRMMGFEAVWAFDRKHAED